MITSIIYNSSQLLRHLGFNFNEEKDIRVLEMKKKINQLGSIEFKTEQFPDGSLVAESTNIDGIITGGLDLKEKNSTIKDAIFTYFEIPPHLVNDELLRANNEPVTVQQKVFATK